jgi:hypothetical protein
MRAGRDSPVQSEEQKAGLCVVLHSVQWISAGHQAMWSSGKYLAMAIAGAGLTMGATPASACLDWGYSGIYSYGWPYANTGFAQYPAYIARSCGGYYNIPGWGECGGYGRCGWAPFPAVVAAAPVIETAPGERNAAGRPLVTRALTKIAGPRRSPRE